MLQQPIPTKNLKHLYDGKSNHPQERCLPRDSILLIYKLFTSYCAFRGNVARFQAITQFGDRQYVEAYYEIRLVEDQ